MSQTRPTIVIQAPKLREQFRNMVIAEAQKRNMDFQEPRYGQEACLFVYGDDFCVVECSDGRFYYTSNHGDPENPITPQEAAAKLVELMKHGEIDEDGNLKTESMEPEQFYGGYANSLIEAIEAIDRMKNSPVSEWPKEYIKPKPPLMVPGVKTRQ